MPTNTAGIVIGIDPGKDSGIAVVTIERHPRLLFSRRCKTVCANNRPTTVTPFIAEALASAPAGRVLVAIEDQFVAVNMRTAVVLAQRTGQWVEACLAAGLTNIERIAPAKWHAREIGCSRLGRTVLKQMSVAKVRGLWGLTLTSDVADAALIARYHAIAQA